MQDQKHYLLNVLELREGTGIDWKSLDSHNIQIVSSLLLLLQELTSNLQVTIAKNRRTSSSCRCHCSGSLRRFFEGLIDHVVAVEWWLLTIHKTHDRVIVVFSISIHSISRTRIETEVNVTVGFCLGLALAMVFAEAVSSSSVVSIDSVTYLSTPFTMLTSRNGIVLKQRWNLNFNIVSIIMIANLHVHDCADSRILENPSILLKESFFHCEASYILGISVASLVLLLYQEYRSIVLCRQASNPHQNIVWFWWFFWQLFEFLLVFLHKVFPLLCIGRCFLRWRGR